MKNMKILLAFSVTCLVTGVYGFAADKEVVVVKSTTTPAALLVGDDKTEIKDYKSFLQYATNKEQIAVKAGKLPSLQANEVFKLKEEKIELSKGKPFGETSDYTKEAYLGAEKQIAVYDKKTHMVHIVDNNGRLIKEGKITKFQDDGGMLAFSDTRIFVIGGVVGSNGGFKIFDYTGNLVKEINSGFVDGYAVSRTAKYFGVTVANPKNPYYFILYDMDGNELWKQQVVSGGHAEIEFSRDDKFAVLKLPNYWIKDKISVPNKTVSKERKLYVINIESHIVISEEDYEK